MEGDPYQRLEELTELEHGDGAAARRRLIEEKIASVTASILQQHQDETSPGTGTESSPRHQE